MASDWTGFGSDCGKRRVFWHYFSELPDHRHPARWIIPLPEVLLLILLAVLAGAEAFTDIARLQPVLKVVAAAKFWDSQIARKMISPYGWKLLPSLLAG